MMKLIKNVMFKATGLFPQKLPIGREELNKYCSKLFDVYKIPNNPIHKHALCSMIMNLGPTVFYKAPYYFALSIKKAQANQVAYSMLMEIREQEKKDALEEANREKESEKAVQPSLGAEPIQDQAVH